MEINFGKATPKHSAYDMTEVIKKTSRNERQTY